MDVQGSKRISRTLTIYVITRKTMTLMLNGIILQLLMAKVHVMKFVVLLRGWPPGQVCKDHLTIKF